MKSFLNDQQKHKLRPCSKREGHNLLKNLDRLLWVSPVMYVTLMCVYWLARKPLQDIHGHPSFPTQVPGGILSLLLYFLSVSLLNRGIPLISRKEAHIPALNMSHYFPCCSFTSIATCAVTKPPGWGHALFSKPGIWPFKKHCNRFASLSQTWTSELHNQISLPKILKYSLRAKVTFQFAQTPHGLHF